MRTRSTVNQIALQEMILPLVVRDVHAEVAKNADYTLTVERSNGFPARVFAIVPD